MSIKKKIALTLFCGLALTGGAAYFFLPSYLVKVATQKPQDIEEFVTQPVPEVNLGDKISESVERGNIRQSAPQTVPKRNSQLNTQTKPNSPISQGQEQPSLDQNSTQQSEQNLPGIEIQELKVETNATQPETNATPPANQSTQLAQEPEKMVKPHADSNSFRVKISQQEISGMIFNGIYRNSAQPYRPALKGVSVKLNQSIGKITIALAPAYLPDQMLKQFPGVTKDTPTIYIGGEVSLQLSNNQLNPIIHNISVGQFKMPVSFIQSMVKTSIHQQLQNMLKLRSGQKAVLQGIEIEGGLLVIKGVIV